MDTEIRQGRLAWIIMALVVSGCGAKNPPVQDDAGMDKIIEAGKQVPGRYVLEAAAGGIYLVDTAQGKVWHQWLDPKTNQPWFGKVDVADTGPVASK